jgi:hypothetical protein
MAALQHADALVAHAPVNGLVADGFSLEGQEPKPIFNLEALERISPEMLAWVRKQLS